MSDSLTSMLRYWAADREGVSALQITNVEFVVDPGFGGSDVTPPEPPSCCINYTVSHTKMIEIDHRNMGNFLAEIAEVASRGPL